MEKLSFDVEELNGMLKEVGISRFVVRNGRMGYELVDTSDIEEVIEFKSRAFIDMKTFVKGMVLGRNTLG